eukprot:CAMPEP_0197345764 /NCGR_PEP_ID=MMETSP0893-20130614/4551_1 /TAXON_ID=44058 ORGANISM="Aureoumbra lagunensis, Strain CCMP1510" /NCGR_SAMPLE_ID=MMETSP0893 /ASSEMBLY_ACC=CAM_ASM_000539 /LENGTH=55 /DNA_ID=CAMNT_0042853911 /DNA_START=429 /DNA_END=592 /DNA_ORIENTATION=-
MIHVMFVLLGLHNVVFVAVQGHVVDRKVDKEVMNTQVVVGVVVVDKEVMNTQVVV